MIITLISLDNTDDMMFVAAILRDGVFTYGNSKYFTKNGTFTIKDMVVTSGRDNVGGGCSPIFPDDIPIFSY